MSDETTPNSNAMPEDEDPQTGEPIKALQDLEEDPSPFFLRTIRGKIRRRTAASQMVSACWQLPKVVFVELAKVLIGVFGTSSRRKGG